MSREGIRSAEIAELIVRYVLDDSSDCNLAVTKGLLTAHSELWEDEQKDSDVEGDWVPYPRAFEHAKRCFVTGYQQVLPTVPGHALDDLWPNALPCDPMPLHLIKTIFTRLGVRAGLRDQA